MENISMKNLYVHKIYLLIKTLVVGLILILNLYKKCNSLDHFISNNVSNTCLQYFHNQFKWTLSILHCTTWYWSGFSITCILIFGIIVTSISFMKFAMTFWPNHPIVNKKYVFLTSVLLLDTVFVKPVWNEKF